jgi:hypothetical protein
MKNGGAELRVIERGDFPNPGDEDWRGTVLRNARKVADLATDDAPLAGYVLIGLYADGGASVGFRYDKDRTPIPRALFPAWVAEVLRRDMITAHEAEITFDNMFEWRDDL